MVPLIALFHYKSPDLENRVHTVMRDTCPLSSDSIFLSIPVSERLLGSMPSRGSRGQGFLGVKDSSGGIKMATA